MYDLTSPTSLYMYHIDYWPKWPFNIIWFLTLLAKLVTYYLDQVYYWPKFDNYFGQYWAILYSQFRSNESFHLWLYWQVVWWHFSAYKGGYCKWQDPFTFIFSLIIVFTCNCTEHNLLTPILNTVTSHAEWQEHEPVKFNHILKRTPLLKGASSVKNIIKHKT